MSRAYYQSHVTVLQFDSDASLLDKLGSGTITVEAAEYSNDALNDEWEDGEFGKKKATFSGKFACDTDDTSWFMLVGEKKTLTMTSDTETITGTFGVVSAAKSADNAITWDVSLKSKGAITITQN